MSLLSRLAVQAARAYGILSAADKTKVVADYLVVAGGASGGSTGGGGAGGLLTSTATLSTLNTYSITVGAGGALTSANARGNSGSNSVMSGTGLTTITATGGGGGGAEAISPNSGGSGGGGGGSVAVRSGGAASPSGQGFAGGNGNDNGAGSAFAGGGGGGAGAVGSNASTASTAGNGGNGSSSSISGSSVTYAGGGGGGAYLGGGTGTAGTGGTGGGGNGGRNGLNATSGTANTGGGGGGNGFTSAGNYQGNSGAGGSGIVIISYTSATPKFVGGTITTSGGNQIHTFTSSGTLSPITPITASYLVVAGGGGGGNAIGGGGGAGGLLTSSTTLYSGATYVVTVGAGGAGGTNSSSPALGVTGSSSSMSGTGLTTITTTGGGGGGAGSTVAGLTGGSGGGGSGINGAGGSPTSGQGFAGGAGSSGSGNYGAGGGGGSSAVGGTGNTTTAGSGGAGTSSSISGTSVTYAGGGGGGTFSAGTAGTGGTGGGGAGSNTTVIGVSGTPNTGGGGGGGFQSSGGTNYNGGAGGSGIVIISYAGSQQFNGGLVTTSGGNTIHTFTSTGALTPLTNNLNNSLRFRSSASAYLNRTFGTGSGTISTFSAWVKRGTLGSVSPIMFVSPNGTEDAGLQFDSNNNLSFSSWNGAGGRPLGQLITTQVFRDPSAWYHIVLAIDTTQATSSNRLKLYVNGNQVTAFGTATYPSQNATHYWNLAYEHRLGRYAASAGTNYIDGYLADVNFIDGQALEPYYFGNNDANGVWKPILYKGTYGTNGFYLTFGNTTSTTTLGYDSSPNGNNWTCNNISLTAGTTYDAMTDVPTNTSATVANYCTLNPLAKVLNSPTITDGNLKSTGGVTVAASTILIPTTGKWYCEGTVLGITNAISFGIGNRSPSRVNYINYENNGQRTTASGGVAYGSTYTTNDVIGIAVDSSASTITFYKNNVSQGAINLSVGSLTVDDINFECFTFSSGNDIVAMNFGQRPFAYTPPTGYVALNTYNLPTPTILQGNKYMDATLWTGNGATSNVIVNAGQFKPDFVWVKSRSAVKYNILTDSVRGTNSQLFSNDTLAQETRTDRLTAFNSNGFSLGNWNDVNNTSETYVGWQWQAGQGSTSSNTSGSITSTVSVNTTAGFSVVTYTSQASGSATFGHGLGVAPSMIFLKGRNVAGGWYVYHSALGGTKYLALQSTGAATTAADGWNNTNPTSTLVTVGNGYAGSYNMVAYCWAEIAGFSKAFSYTGNGSTDGPFTYLGFRPKFVLIKNTSTAGTSWVILDTTRNTYNIEDAILYPNVSNAEATFSSLDGLSNGFKIRNIDGSMNTNGNTYIGMAFAENPFKNANAR